LGEAVSAIRLSTRETSPWKVLGGANVVDGSQPTGASASAVVSMYQRALASCDLSADAIDLIKVQAAGSPGNDAVEAQGLREAFNKMPALVSLKDAMGHTMGASGVAEIVLVSACLEQGVLPKHADDTDQSLGVDLVEELPPTVRHLMATILGFGGSHATVVLQRA
jgi:3-oxoacyl-[acyl-carrier-protein] synthase-1